MSLRDTSAHILGLHQNVDNQYVDIFKKLSFHVRMSTRHFSVKLHTKNLHTLMYGMDFVCF